MHGKFHQTHGTVHQKLLKILMKVHETVHKKKCNSLLNPSKNTDEHVKSSSLEEDYVKIIGNRPLISCHVSPIGQNIVIPNKIFSVRKLPDHNRQNIR